MAVKKNYTPLYNELEKYISSNPTAFHMPGHKMGKGLSSEFLSKIGMLDLTEIPGTDNLHKAEGPIKEAQKLAAEAFGAQQTYFLVNGSTCGIHAMIMAVCKKGDKLIVARDCHKAVITGMLLAGVDPIFIPVGFDTQNSVPTPVEASFIEKALEAYPQAVGVLITRPNYYGLCCDINEICRIVHARGKVLMVDEAHGAHFNFHNNLPETAMDCCVDICVQSAHKTLPAMTQTALLHVGTKNIDTERLKFYLGLLQTSSPSYVLMASLDIARSYMEEYGYGKLDTLIKYIDAFEHSLEDFSVLSVLTKKNTLAFDKDRTRIVVNVEGTSISGYEFDKLLRAKYNIQVEMSDMSNIVCICTVADEEQDVQKLANAIIDISQGLKREKDSNYYDTAEENKGLNYTFEPVSLCQTFEAPGMTIPFRSALGEISKSIVVPYPPGIPVIMPGETIQKGVIDYVEKIIALGGEVQGLTSDNKINVVSYSNMR